MSSIKVSDKRGGMYEAVIQFSYGECERLPFNILRRIRARIKTVPGGGIVASAAFNIRSPGESSAFLEMLDMFGEEGAFPHGSAADPAALARTIPPDGDDGLLSVDDDDDDLELDGTLGG